MLDPIDVLQNIFMRRRAFQRTARRLARSRRLKSDRALRREGLVVGISIRPMRRAQRDPYTPIKESGCNSGDYRATVSVPVSSRGRKRAVDRKFRLILLANSATVLFYLKCATERGLKVKTAGSWARSPNIHEMELR
jgi:hypothetical protein